MKKIRTVQIQELIHEAAMPTEAANVYTLYRKAGWDLGQGAPGIGGPPICLAEPDPHSIAVR